MSQVLEIDIRDVVLANGSFGPTEIRQMVEAIGRDTLQINTLRDAVAELEQVEERTPASSVRLGVCQYLLGKYRDATNTLSKADGGAVAHFYLSTIGYGSYVENLKKGMNPIRFYEYALSSSLMIVLIGMLIGLWDLGAILLIFTLNATMNLFGIMMEKQNHYTQKVDWSSFIYGCIAGFIPWVVITLYFLGAVNSGDAKPPSGAA